MVFYRVLPVINDFFFNVSRGIGNTVRSVLIFMCCILLNAIFFFEVGFHGDEDIGRRMIFGSVLLFVMSVLYANMESKKVICNKKLCVPLNLFAIGIIIISFIHPIGPGYLMFAIDMLIVFPLFYYCVINSNGVNSLYRLFATSVVIEGVIAFLLCLLMAANGELGIHGIRIMGHTSNPNLLGMLGLVMIVSGVYLLISRVETILCVVSSLAVGAGISFIIISSSRTAFLAMLGCVAAAVIFIIKTNSIRGICNIISVRLIIFLVVIAMSFVVGIQLGNINSQFEESGTDHSVQTLVENDSEDEAKTLKNRISFKKDLNTYTSGRTGIWMIYIQNFSFLGKDLKEIEHNFPQNSEWRAHNNIIDYYYRFGYIVGSLYLIFFIVLCGTGARMLFKKAYNSPDSFFLVEVVGCYVLYALVEIATLPFIRCVPLLFFVFCGPLMMGIDRKERPGDLSNTLKAGDSKSIMNSDCRWASADGEYIINDKDGGIAK